MTDDITAMWKEIRSGQKNRRSARLAHRIETIESWGIPFRRLNGDYHLRFELDDGTIVDYWPVHSVIRIRGKRPRKLHGIKTLKKELGLK